MDSEESPHDDGISITVGAGVSRREVMKQFGAAGVLFGAAGCLADDDDTPGGTPGTPATDPLTDTPTKTPVDKPWRQFSYDAANSGHAPDNTGPDGEIAQRWRFPEVGGVSSSPVVEDGTVYLGTQTGVTAVSATDRSVDWQFQTRGGVTSSPVVVGGTVYVGGTNRTVYALDAGDGTELWTFQTVLPRLSSPVVVDGTVYVGSADYTQDVDGIVYALDASDGTEQWTFRTGDDADNSPAVVGGTVYVGSSDGNVYALDAGDGTEQWAFDTGSAVVSSPAVVDRTVYVEGSETMYALDASGGTEQWAFQMGSLSSDPTVVDGTVYFGTWNETVHALDAGDGTEQWTFQADDWVVSSPTVVGGTVYVGSWDGNVYALDAGDGTEQWAFQTGFEVWSSPAVGDGTVYVGNNDDTVYALDAGDGTEQWTLRTGSPGVSSPAVVDGTVYIGSHDRNVHALDAGDGSQQWAFRTDMPAGSPAVVDGTVYVKTLGRLPTGTAVPGEIYALDAGDGTEQWAFDLFAVDEQLTSERKRSVSPPTVVDGTVYVGSREVSNQDDTVYALDARDGTEQWSSRMDGQVSSPAVVDGFVYVETGETVYALDAEDGTEKWSFRRDDSGWSAPAVVDGTVYVGNSDGTVYALDGGDGTEQWSFRTDGEVDSSPAVAEGTVYVGSGFFPDEDGTVYALDARDGTEQWTFKMGGPVSSSPAVVDGTVYVGSTYGTVYALNAGDGTEQWTVQTSRGMGRTSPAVVDGTVYVPGAHLYAVGSERGTLTATETGEKTDTEISTGTAISTPAESLGDAPAPLLSLGGGSASPGGTTTIEGTLENPYPFDVHNVSVSLSGPSGWDISTTGSTTFDTIDSQGTESTSWEVTVPDDASGAYDLTATVSYETATDSAEVDVTGSVSVYPPGDIPQEGLELYYSLDTDTPVNAVTGTEATVVGEPSSGASGIVGNAWEFTTDGSVETVADTIISEPLPINGEGATVGAWINHGAIQEAFSRVYHIDQEGKAAGTSTDNPPTKGWNIEFDRTNNAVNYQYWNEGDLGAQNIPKVPCPQDTWIFVVTVVDGGDCTIYTFDESGQLDGSPGTGTGTRPTTDMAQLILMTGAGRDTPGRMDEVRAYSRALSEDEVMQLYYGSIGQ